MSAAMRNTGAVFTAMVFLFSTANAIAAGQAKNTAAPVDMTTTMLKTAGALALIIGLILVAVWLARRFGGPGLRGGAMTSLIKVLDTRMLGPKKYVTVLKIGGRTLAVGVTEQKITLLCEMAADDLPVEETQGPGATPAFADILKKLAPGGKN